MSELNGNGIQLRDMSKIELSSNGSTNKIRPTDLNLKPFKLPTLPEDGYLEPEESTSSSAASSISNKYFKRIDIGFSDLSYSVKTGIFKQEKRSILRRINGEFHSGELTAILGPSGAGKSSLMNILAGYTTKNVSGFISINGRERDEKKFRRQSAYIMQDHELQPMLTVLEAMYFSVNLKIGEELTQENKKKRIKELLKALGIEENKRTLTGKLSGGQKKRLAIALELVNNPPVMFFDEPTSGLDSSSSKQCISLLKKLANEGRTIICTIHQPSALLFEMFDLLFAVAGGECIYTGGVSSLIPVLSEVGLKCPEFHNPADYLLEISTNDYGEDKNEKLVEKVLNGKCQKYRKRQTESFRLNAYQLGRVTSQITTNKLLPLLETPAIEEKPFPLPKKQKSIINPARWCKRDERYSTSFLRQFCLLVMRTFLILKRDKSLTTMRLLIHASVAPFIGILYFKIGNDASNVFNNFNYIFFSIMFLMFTAFSSMTMAFPVELPIITREHFNRWYSLRVYYLAMTLADAPIQICCTFIYTLITYLMTAQPLELYRIGLFFGMCLMVAFVAQGLGLVVGSLFDVKNGAIWGPFFICPFLIFSGFFIHLNDAHVLMQWLFHISFLKYALEGAALAIFGYDRPKMDCEEVYCQFVLPKKFMKEIDMHNGNYGQATTALIIIFLIFRVLAFYIMRYRLRNKR